MVTDPQARQLPRSRVSLFAEAAVLTAACFLAFIWLIPVQTSEGGIGLSPAFLPKLCVAAIGGLIAAAVVRSGRPTVPVVHPSPATTDAVWLYVKNGGVAVPDEYRVVHCVRPAFWYPACGAAPS